MSTLESFGISISDEQYETMARQARLAAYIQPAATLITFPVVTVVVAGVLFVVFYALVGGGATFRQMVHRRDPRWSHPRGHSSCSSYL